MITTMTMCPTIVGCSPPNTPKIAIAAMAMMTTMMMYSTMVCHAQSPS
jgi:hypothetical protein